MLDPPDPTRGQSDLEIILPFFVGLLINMKHLFGAVTLASLTQFLAKTHGHKNARKRTPASSSKKLGFVCAALNIGYEIPRLDANFHTLIPRSFLGDKVSI